MLPLRPGARGAADLGHPRPQPARRPQLGDGEELVGGRRVAELQLSTGLFDAQARLGQLPQIRHRRGQRGTQLLGGRATGLVEGQRVHGQGPQPRVLRGAQPRELRGRRDVTPLPGPGLVPQGIRAQVAARRVPGDPPLLVQPQQLPCGGLGFASRVEDDGGQVEVDTVEDPAELRDRDAVVPDRQPDGRDTVLQVREHRVAVGRRVPLPYVPAADRVPLGPGAPHKGREPGEPRLGRGVVRGVEGPGAQPVLQRGGQGFLGLGPLDVLARFAQYTRHKALPLLMGHIRELAGQLKPVVRQDRHARMLGHEHEGAAEGTAVTFPSP
ncbi:hypothetical protein DF19_31750 [Streptomyces olindensis]|nr:hypothetical protein DF19_31750 [Streptomyces olindensis]